MATLMTIRPDAARTATEQATFQVLATEALIINPETILPGELEVAADKVICAEYEEPVVYTATDLIMHLMQIWRMKMIDALEALKSATAEGEHIIVHI
jgi:hypothetical protein